MSNLHASEQLLNDEYFQSCFIDKSRAVEAGVFFVLESKKMRFVRRVFDDGILDDTGQFFKFEEVQLVSKEW